MRETLARYRVRTPRRLLFDLSLPDSHGLDTITRLCGAARHADSGDDGLDGQAHAGEAVRCGAEDYLVKGQTDARSLVQVVRYAVERKGTSGR